MAGPSTYTVNDFLGTPVQVPAGQTAQQALDYYYKNVLGTTPEQWAAAGGGGTNQTNTTPQWNDVYNQSQLNDMLHTSPGAMLNNPDTGAPMSIQDYMNNIGQFQAERQGGTTPQIAPQQPAAAPGMNIGGGTATPQVSTGGGSSLSQGVPYTPPAAQAPAPVLSGGNNPSLLGMGTAGRSVSPAPPSLIQQTPFPGGPGAPAPTPPVSNTGPGFTGGGINTGGTAAPPPALLGGPTQQFPSQGIGMRTGPGVSPGTTVTQGPGGQPIASPTPPLSGPTQPFPTSTAGGPAPVDPGGLGSLFSPAPQIGNITLGANPQISGTFNPDVMNQWQNTVNNTNGSIGNAYNWTTPQAQAAQVDTSGIPQVQAQGPQSFDALQFLLSGQGYDPSTLARMNANNTDSVYQNASAAAGNARRAAEQAGLGGSGAGLALQQMINRNAGAANQTGLNNIAISNAQQGMQNLQQGAGLELNRQTSDAGMANQVALQNAANLFNGMMQNVQNMQQTNLQNNQNTYNQKMTGANAQSGFLSGAGQTFNTALLGKGTEADTMNAANDINRNLNNAQLQRGADIFNTNTGENRYNNSFNAAMGLIGGSNPSGTAGQAATTGSAYTPNLIGANATSNAGNILSNLATIMGNGMAQRQSATTPP